MSAGLSSRWTREAEMRSACARVSTAAPMRETTVREVTARPARKKRFTLRHLFDARGVLSGEESSPACNELAKRSCLEEHEGGIGRAMTPSGRMLSEAERRDRQVGRLCESRSEDGDRSSDRSSLRRRWLGFAGPLGGRKRKFAIDVRIAKRRRYRDR